MPKIINVYGVEMTSLQEMKFYKYLKNFDIAMNTITSEQRTRLANNFLKVEKEELEKYLYNLKNQIEYDSAKGKRSRIHRQGQIETVTCDFLHPNGPNNID